MRSRTNSTVVFFAPTLSSVAPGQTFKSDITYLHSGVAVVASAGQAPAAAPPPPPQSPRLRGGSRLRSTLPPSAGVGRSPRIRGGSRLGRWTKNSVHVGRAPRQAKKTRTGRASVGACRSARRVHEWHQRLGCRDTQAHRCIVAVDQRQKPFCRAVCNGQAIYQARLVATACGPSSAFPAASPAGRT